MRRGPAKSAAADAVALVATAAAAAADVAASAATAAAAAADAVATAIATKPDSQRTGFGMSRATRSSHLLTNQRRNQSTSIRSAPFTNILTHNHCRSGDGQPWPTRAAEERFMNSDNFHKLGLSAPLVKVIERLGLNVPTDIQTKAIPPALAGQNVMATAETGSGKTAAFLLPIIERLKRRGAARALVLAPMRELASQIEANARGFSRAAGLRTVSVVGGESLGRQIKALGDGVDIIIATPGRLNDLIERRAVRLNQIEALVLDEADRMLDMGFLPQVRRIIAHIPRERQTMMFTATLSRAVEALARELLSDCVRVTAARKVATT